MIAKRELYQQIKDKYPNSRYIVFGDGLGDEEATKEVVGVKITLLSVQGKYCISKDFNARGSAADPI